MSRRATAALTALLLLLFALPAAATSTRLLSMGGGGDYFEDVDNVQRWFGSLATYPDLMLLELGESSGNSAVGQALGAHLSLDPAHRFGVAGLWIYDDDPRQDVRLMWGLKCDAWQAGLQARFGNEARITTSYDYRTGLHSVDEAEAWTWSLGAGLRLDLAPRTWVDVAYEGTMTRVQAIEEEAVLFSDRRSLDSFALRWRLFHGLSERLVLVPCVTWERDLRPELVYGDWFGSVYDYDGIYYLGDARSFSAGLGLSLLPDPDRMLQASLTWSRDESRLTDPATGVGTWLQRQDVETDALSIRLGGEMRVLHWLTVRAGVWKTMSENVIKRYGAEWWNLYGGIGRDEMDASLGCGLHFGAFDADMMLTDAAPFRAGGLLTGTTGGNALWSRITLQVVF
ncbi:MAG: hypothetical protein Q7W56_09140 [Candidatus Latescibacteria bacterium]|nr:hypothetical protein [Candidatus Latescibacterota bacterium]